ncbi:MAG: 4-hydroxy-2-oxovalerate aldolase [Lachnospiraceae bacterium]|nr:4-hydroxy-2-oxovalerate aldolase [Lachnospiraceae bacterium]
MRLMDCTLRDGSNVLGKGFPADLTVLMLRGLTDNGIKVIEYGNAGGIGAYALGNLAPCNDLEYLELAQPFVNKAEIGMFLNAKRYREENVALAKQYGLKFLRIGAEPGLSDISVPIIKEVKRQGLTCRYSLMKAYLATPEEAVKEALVLEAAGLDELTVMDSAGCMKPDDVAEYFDALVGALKIPVLFHGHSNLGLAPANALKAIEHGAAGVDCGLLGMARSAGNIPTELMVALLQDKGYVPEVDFYGLMQFLNDELVPAMAAHGYKPGLLPMDLILGLSGTHSSFMKTFKKVADEEGVNLMKLIVETSKLNRRNPSEEQMRAVAATLK